MFRSLLTAFVIAPIRFYQKFISPAFAPRCKYYPSCSSYAVTAITRYGFKGLAMSGWRLLRCNPWSHGGVDYPGGVKTPAGQSLQRVKEAA